MKNLLTKIRHYIKEMLLFIVIITIFSNIISFYKSTELNKKSLNAINIQLIDKQHYRFPKDKPILIHFWATWCPTCKIEASNIQTISQNFEVLTIAVKSGTDEEIQKYLDENSLNYRVLNDKSGFFSSEFNIAAYPTTFIYNKNRELVFSEVGYTSTFGLYLRVWWASL